MSTYPGKINNKTYEFPAIKYEDSSGRARQWRIFVRLVSISKNNPTAVNWIPAESKCVQLNSRNMLMTTGILGQSWAEYGIVDANTTISVPTYIDAGKNIGRANETSIYWQTMSEAHSKYKLILKKHNTVKDLYYPIAVHKHDEVAKNSDNNIVYPAMAQPKYDGIRAVLFMRDGVPFMYSRRLTPILMYRNLNLDVLFTKINKLYPGIYIDGELYVHGLSLQEISGIARNETATDYMEYHVFDMFIPGKLLTLEVRINILEIIREMVPKSSTMKISPTVILKNRAQDDRYYRKMLKIKYEGTVVKNIQSLYEYSNTSEIRTWQCRKRKPRWSSEYKVIGFNQGTKGKDKGLIIWKLVTSTGVEFTSTPVGINNEERRRLFTLFTLTPKAFNKYKNKMMTVEFDDISDAGVPLRAKAKCLRTMP